MFHRKIILFEVLLLCMPAMLFSWTMNGHRRLAEKIFNHPTISAMLTTSGLNEQRIVDICANGDFHAAHDWYGGWNDFNYWENFKNHYLIDAQRGSSVKLSLAYLDTKYQINFYSVPPEIIINDPGHIFYNYDSYWGCVLDAEYMFGLFLHNLTDCAVPVGHEPAKGLPYVDGSVELSFETCAANDPIPDYSQYSFTRDETNSFFQNYSAINEAQFSSFWSTLSGRFYDEMINNAQRLKDHAGSGFTTSAWLSDDCFAALLRFAVFVTYKYLENTKAYDHPNFVVDNNLLVTRITNFSIPDNMVSLYKAKPDLSPIINLLLE